MGCLGTMLTRYVRCTRLHTRQIVLGSPQIGTMTAAACFKLQAMSSRDRFSHCWHWQQLLCSPCPVECSVLPDLQGPVGELGVPVVDPVLLQGALGIIKVLACGGSSSSSHQLGIVP